MIGLRTCIYKVENLNEAKSWYSKAFQVAPYFDEPYYVGFNIGGFELGLQTNEQDQPKSENIHVYWGVKNISKEYKRLLELGATHLEEPNNVGGELMVASVKDPWNNIIGLIFNPHFKVAK